MASNADEHSNVGCNPFRRLFQRRSQAAEPEIKTDKTEQLLQEAVIRLEKLEIKQKEQETKAAENTKRGFSRFFSRFSRSDPKVKDKKKNKKKSKRGKKNAKSDSQMETNGKIAEGDGKEGQIASDSAILAAQPRKRYLTSYQSQKIILQWAKRQNVTSDYEKRLISIMEDLDAAGDIFNQPRPINKKYAKSCDSVLNEKMYDLEEGEYIIEYGSEYSYEIDFDPVVLPLKDETPNDEEDAVPVDTEF